MKKLILFYCISLSLLACKQEKKENKAPQEISAAVAGKEETKTMQDSIIVMPVEHASLRIT